MPKIAVVGIPDGWSSMQLTSALEKKTGFGMCIDMSELRLDLHDKQVRYHGESLNNLDGLIIKKIGPVYTPDLLDRLTTLTVLKEQGIPIFSDPVSVKAVLDRHSCTTTLANGDIPIPPTVVTECSREAESAIREFGKVVLKPLYTSKARGMMVVEATDDVPARLQEYIQAGNTTIYIQKFIELNGRDLGLAFLGGKFLSCYSRVGNKDSWNTTTNSGGKYQPFEPSQDLIDLAKKAQDLFSLDFTCVDIAITEEGPFVFEVSAFGGFRGLLEACNINAADLLSEYVIEKVEHAA